MSADKTESSLEDGSNQIFECKWVDCSTEQFPALTNLVSHLNHQHLAHMAHLTPTTPIRYTCQWQGCPRFGIEQPSRFALISHCRTHTGEKPYFCPLPECEKHFTRSDALAKHVKGVHDLHTIKDALNAFKDKLKKGTLPNGSVLDWLDWDDVSEESYLRLIEQDYDYKNPWWFSKQFLNILRQANGLPIQNGEAEKPVKKEQKEEDGNQAEGDQADEEEVAADAYEEDDKFLGVSEEGYVTLDALYNLPLDFKHHKIAAIRYQKYLVGDENELIAPKDENNATLNLIKRQQLHDNPGSEKNGRTKELNSNVVHEALAKETKNLKAHYEDDSLDVDDVHGLEDLKALHDKLTNQLNTAHKINKLVGKQLSTTVKQKRKLWLINQLLIDGNLEVGLPLEPSDVPQRVDRDYVDDELLRG